MRTALLAVTLLLLLSPFGPADPLLARPEDDGRVGSVLDLQGVAMVRPVGRQRWTPLSPRSLLMPGDQVKTFARGAHAVEMRLVGGGALTLGPNGLVELESRTTVRLMNGDLEASGVNVSMPGGEAHVKKRTVFRVRDREFTVLAKDPRWLTGYRSSTTDEWMGSLIADVDGRNTPLTIGYHKVDVVIRDQIAVTTIEESFVNHTSGRLEGIFTFPLPADASISGFGMWIGDELVMADIVEKQRAREIYEDILRRRKDPGLLEWSGGNLFKARVFPIFAHSEKRIKIRYTQVLPLSGKSLRYQYALRSELLRANPLRELKIKVTVHSEMPIAKAASLSHECRIRTTENDAVIEYDARETTPERDFEVRLDLGRKPALAAVPHRRGENGYFMLLLSPPDAAADGWQRELTPEGDPLDLVILADTSGSMDPAQRDAQADFLQALLALVSEKDRVRIAACDTDVNWLDEGRRAEAVSWLTDRHSLGWSDMDRALKDALFVSGEGSHVIYLGDGIGTTGDADPVDLARRIGLAAGTTKATVHAVSTGTAYERVVLDALAAIGGGSVRAADPDPAAAAYGLLAELAQPTVKDLRVSVEGIRTARVYPKRPANLPAGAQHAILGRFLPTGKAQTGTVTVTGSLDGKPVRYSTALSIEPGELGNSFLPRLWARRHLDALLAQGASKEVQEEIVAFSEEFGIMTPYTSFLVLESDEDRERYGVTRRVAMRDGERFFTEAKDKANIEILRQQMRAAKTWRLNLRRRALAEIAGLGRNLQVAYGYYGYSAGGGGGGHDYRSTLGVGGGAAGGPMDSGHIRLEGDGSEFVPAEAESSGDGLFDDPVIKDAKVGDKNESAKDLPAEEPFAEELESEARFEGDADSPPAPSTPAPAVKPAPVLEAASKKSRSRADEASSMRNGFFEDRRGGSRGGYTNGRRQNANRWFASGVLGMFPGVPAITPVPSKPPDPEWPDEILALLRSLDRLEVLKTFQGGLESRSVNTSFEAHRGVLNGRSRTHGLLSPKSWYMISGNLAYLGQASWVFDGERGAMFTATGLGRKRPAVESDRTLLAGFPGLGYWSSYIRSYRTYDAEIVSRDDTSLVVRLSYTGPNSPSQQYELILTIDPAKKVVLSQVVKQGGKPVNRTDYRGFKQIGGHWFPTVTETRDAENRLTSISKTELNEMTAADAEKAIAKELERRDEIIFLGPKDPTPEEAKQAVADKKGGLADHLVHMLSFGTLGQWDEMWKQWPAVAAKAGEKRGLDWLRAHLLSLSRRGEELKTLLTAMADRLVKNPGKEPAIVAMQILSRTNSLGANEQLTIRERLRGLFPKEGSEGLYFGILLDRQRANLLNNVGRHDEARKLWESILVRRPADGAVLNVLLNLVAQEGPDALLKFANAQLENDKLLYPHERDSLYQRLAQHLWNSRRYEDVLRIADRWIEKGAQQETAYEMRLAALLHTGRAEEMSTWIEKVLATDLPEVPTREETARLGAAIDAALGQAWNLYTNRVARRWVKPIASRALALMRRETDPGNLSYRVLQHWRIRQTDEYRELIESLRADVGKPGAVEEMSLDRLRRYLYTLTWQKQTVSDDEFRIVSTGVRNKFSAAEKDPTRTALMQYFLHLCDQRGEKIRSVEFLRAVLKSASDARRPYLVAELYRRLAGLPWSVGTEDEFFALLPRIVVKEMSPEQRRAYYAGQARWIASQLFRMKVDHFIGPKAEAEKLPRKELRARTKEGRAATRKALAERFAAEAKKAGKELRPWYEIESISFAVEKGDDLPEVEGRARELLLGGGDEPTDRADRVLRQRCSLVLAYAAVRRGAPKEIADRTLALYREKTDAGSKLLDWRYETFRLLTALDRADDLLAALESFIDPEKVESGWRIAIAYLLAEKGRLSEAAERFEEVGNLEELTEADWAMLADWYLVLGEDVKRARAVEKRYHYAREGDLNRRLQVFARRVRRRGDQVPEDIDPEVFPVLSALLTKTSSPANYIYSIRRIYDSTKDYRLLVSLADGATGHSVDATYPFLTRCAQILANVHEEATCDEVIARLAERMAEDMPPTDRRALKLLEMQIERRAADVLNQPGPHAAKALAALEAAFPSEWRPGEPRQMARFLSNLGRIPDPALAAEQMRQMTVIFDLVEGDVRLEVGYLLANLHWSYGRADPAIDLLDSVLAETRAATGGALPQTAAHYAQILISWLESRKHFGRGEDWLLAEENRQSDPSQRAFYRNRLLTLYRNCLANGGTVSLGTEMELYRAGREVMLNAVFELPPGFCYNALNTFVGMHRTAYRRMKGPQFGRDLIEFSKTKLPEAVRRIPNQRGQMYSLVSGAIRKLTGPKEALTLLIVAIEEEPEWYRDTGQGGWNSFHWQMARWRHEAKSLGDLEPRLERIVLRELENDLVALRHTGTSFTFRSNSYFWREKADRFSVVAQKVLELHADSPATVLFAAKYLWNGLHLHQDAITALLRADQNGRLVLSGRRQLVHWMHHEEQWPASIPHAEKLVAEQSDNLEFHLLLIKGLRRDGRVEAGGARVAATERRFRERKLWTESNIARLGNTCVEERYYDAAARYYEEALSLNGQKGRRRGGDSVRSRYYGRLAEAYSGLGRDDEAVHAASGAVVTWGRTHRRRAQALTSLLRVIEGIGDLDAWAAKYDAKVKETGMDAPVIRKSIGMVYLGRKLWRPAATHLVAARDLSPFDAEIHKGLVRALDGMKDADGAIAALLESGRRLRSDLQVFEDLDRRLERMGRREEAERARTTLAEIAPHEADGHRRLAKIRGRRKEYDAAVVQWAQVVRIRTLEPDGWFMLASAQIDAGKNREALETLDGMIAREWNQRFGDVKKKARAMRAKIGR